MKRDKFVVTNVCIYDGRAETSTFIFKDLSSASDKFHDLKSEAKELFEDSKNFEEKEYVIDEKPCNLIISDKELSFNECIIIALNKIEK